MSITTSQAIIKVIIPAFNEASSIALVVGDIPDFVDEVIVVSNNSTDATEANAANAGATVLTENRPGYGYACLKGMEYLAQQNPGPDIIVFLDGDYSDFPEQINELVAPILNDNVDFVVGARVRRFRESGSMTFPQRFGNWLATSLMRLFFNARFTDLGPFRAIKYNKLLQLQMQDKTYGWTVEMQLKALKQDLVFIL